MKPVNRKLEITLCAPGALARNGFSHRGHVGLAHGHDPSHEESLTKLRLDSISLL